MYHLTAKNTSPPVHLGRQIQKILLEHPPSEARAEESPAGLRRLAKNRGLGHRRQTYYFTVLTTPS